MRVEFSVLATFVVFLLIFHYFWVFRYPQSTLFWHTVDYVWLAIAMVAVVPQVIEIRRYEAGLDEGSAEIDASFALLTLRWHARSDEPCGSLRVPDHRAVCVWKETVGERFAEDLPDSPSNFSGLALRPPPAVTDSIAQAEIELIHAAHREYIGLIRAWRQSYLRAQPTELSLFLLVISPFLLVFAVALRATKVSAQICRDWKRAPRKTSGGDDSEVQEVPEQGTPAS
jgi:hypothetical protein